MKLGEVIVKPTLGRLWLHHLRSTYSVEVNRAALEAIEAALLSKGEGGAGAALLIRLKERGVVEEGAYLPLPVRGESDLVSLELEPIGRCNLSCHHCFVQFSERQMSQEIFEAALAGAARLGAVEITFNGGEPLLHPGCVQWVGSARAAGLRVLLFTNATLVTERVASQLAQAGLARATVSLDGFEEVHDALRGAGAFFRAVRGIGRLVKAGITVHTTTMVHPKNAADLEALRRFCLDELGVRGVRMSTVAKMGRARGREDLQLGHAAFSAVYEGTAPGGGDRPLGGRLPCAAGVDKLYVSASGRVYGCHLFDGVGPELGDLTQVPLEQIYRAPRAAAHRLLRCFRPEELSGCRDCPSLARCQGGCRARAWQMTGDSTGVDEVSCRRHRERLGPSS